MIRTIEELSMRAWPALQLSLYDGWVVRFANGYTKRANSVIPLYASKRDVDEKIAACEKYYQDKGQNNVFKMTEASTPAGLDARLAARGYEAISPTSVQLLNLESGDYEVSNEVSLTTDDTETWHEAFADMNNVDANRRVTHESILGSIQSTKCYASINLDGHIIGCGLGVLQGGFIGIFDIVIDSDYRRHGHGKSLMESLLAWGQENKAKASYLQVERKNDPALKLYEKLGFQEKYHYWYRIKG